MTADPTFERWYRELHPDLVRALWAMCGDRGLACEVVDEALSRAYERWDRVSQMDSPAGWTRTTAVHVLHRVQRRRRLESRLVPWRHQEVEDPPLPDEALWRAVAALPARQREAVALRYVADLPEADVAAALGITEGAASSSLAKARARLADALATDTEVPAR